MVFGIWIPVVILIAALSGAVGNNFRTEFSLPDSDSSDATALLESASRSEAGINSQVVVKTPKGIDDAAVKEAFDRALADIAAINTVPVTVTSPYEMPTQVNKDRTIAFAQISIPRSDRNSWLPVADAIREATAPLAATGAQVAYGGAIFQEFAMPESEALGLLAAVIILVLAFGSVIAITPTFSPRSAGSNSRDFCSAVPQRCRKSVPIRHCIATVAASPTDPRAGSSHSSRNAIPSPAPSG